MVRLGREKEEPTKCGKIDIIDLCLLKMIYNFSRRVNKEIRNESKDDRDKRARFLDSTSSILRTTDITDCELCNVLGMFCMSYLKKNEF